MKNDRRRCGEKANHQPHWWTDSLGVFWCDGKRLFGTKCEKCGSTNLRLRVPPDFPAFWKCKDCEHLQDAE